MAEFIDGYEFEQTGNVLQSIFTRLLAFFNGGTLTGGKTIEVSEDVVAGTHRLSEKITTSDLDGVTDETFEEYGKLKVRMKALGGRTFHTLTIPHADSEVSGVIRPEDYEKLLVMKPIHISDVVDQHGEEIEEGVFYAFDGRVAHTVEYDDMLYVKQTCGAASNPDIYYIEITKDDIMHVEGVYTQDDCPDNILTLFHDNVASSSADGLMSANDKDTFNTMKETVASNTKAIKGLDKKCGDNTTSITSIGRQLTDKVLMTRIEANTIKACSCGIEGEEDLNSDFYIEADIHRSEKIWLNLSSTGTIPTFVRISDGIDENTVTYSNWVSFFTSHGCTNLKVEFIGNEGAEGTVKYTFFIDRKRSNA